MKKILLMSDTHGYIDDAMLQHASQCDEVWHAGDVGNAKVISALENCCKLRGVYGNVDGQDVRDCFPLINRFECDGLTVLMTHIGGYPGNYNPVIKAEIKKKTPAVFISGHSHILKVMPDNECNLLHLNPGAIGIQGFHLVRTMLRFNIVDAKPCDMAVIEYPKSSIGGLVW